MCNVTNDTITYGIRMETIAPSRKQKRENSRITNIKIKSQTCKRTKSFIYLVKDKKKNKENNQQQHKTTNYSDSLSIFDE